MTVDEKPRCKRRADRGEQLAMVSSEERVAALFVRKDSIYKTMPGVDAWDKDRDARNFAGGMPVVAHPPCAQWGRLSWNAKQRPAEKRLALIALDNVDICGGVLEHPIDSKIWMHTADRPGWLYTVDQFWFGHKVRKRTTLYINGVHPRSIPDVPFTMAEADFIVAGGLPRDAEHAKRKRKAWPCRPSVTPREAEATPPAFAEWLVELARRAA